MGASTAFKVPPCLVRTATSLSKIYFALGPGSRACHILTGEIIQLGPGSCPGEIGNREKVLWFKFRKRAQFQGLLWEIIFFYKISPSIPCERKINSLTKYIRYPTSKLEKGFHCSRIQMHSLLPSTITEGQTIIALSDKHRNYNQGCFKRSLE